MEAHQGNLTMDTEDISMPQDRYIAAMKRLRALIEGGRQLTKEDSNTPGDKHTTCSWGLCADDAETWPDAEDHLWPDQFREHGRVAPKYLGNTQRCPMDRRAGQQTSALAAVQGCFHTCRVFKRQIRNGDRETVLRLYDEQIARAERNP
jgi:hypothetical protein